MADALSRLLWGDDDGDLLTQTQSPIERPAPIPRPDPIEQPRYERAPRQAPPRMVVPPPRQVAPQRPPQGAPRAPGAVQPAPAGPPAATAATSSADPPASDASLVWLRLMGRHQVPREQLGVLVDYYYQLDRSGGQAATPPGLPPALDADIRGYAKRYPGQGVGPSEPEPKATLPQAAAPAQPPPTPSQPAPSDSPLGRLLDEALGPQAAAPASPRSPAARPVDPNAEPDAQTWYGRAWQSVRGKKDPRYANVPAIPDVLFREPGSNKGGQSLGEMGRWLLGASDDDMARFYKERLGSRFIGFDKDANGAAMIRYRDEAGQPAVAYVNRPGLDAEDVFRGIFGVAPFIVTGGLTAAATRGAGGVARTGAQATTAGATSVAQDATAAATDVSEFDPVNTATKAGVAAAGGAAGEVVGIAGSAIWRKLVTEPRFYNRAAGTLTPAGEDAARAAGLDPATLPREVAQEFGRQMARTGVPPIAGRAAAQNEFKIPRTQGELSGNQNQLLREQQITGGSYGDAPANAMRAFRQQQDRAIRESVSGPDGIAGQIAPGRAGSQMTKDEMGANIRGSANAAYSTARGAEREAWEAVPTIGATPGALQKLPQVVASKLDDVVIDDVVTPAAAKMAKRLDEFMSGQAPAKVAQVLPDGSIGDVGAMRKQLLSFYRAAASPEDKRAAKALYEAFNDWVPIAAAETADPAAAAAMVTARGISRQIHEVFDGAPGTPANRIMKQILGQADSAEGVVNALFTSSVSQTKNGAVTALGQLKRAYDTYLPPEAAKAAWDDLRLAYWQRITRLKTGEEGGPAALSAAIKNAINTQGSIAKTLFTPEERGRMMRLAGLLDDIKKRNPNTSWSGVSIGAFMRDIGGAVLRMLGANSVFAQTAARFAVAPVQGAYGSTLARQATGAGRGAAPPVLPAPSRAGYGAGAAVINAE